MNTLSTTKVAVGMFSIALGSFLFAGVDLQRKYSILKTSVVSIDQPTVTGVSSLVKKVNDALTATPKIETNQEIVVKAFKIQQGINTLNYPPTPGIVFRVQVLASKKQVVSFPPEVKGLNLKVDYEKGTYKYLVGEFKSPAQSEDLLNNLAILGYNDAFVVAYKDGKPIPVKKAIKEMRM